MNRLNDILRIGWDRAGICLLFSVICTFSMCKKERDNCPPYVNPAFDKWFPYEPMQKFIFVNDSGQTSKFEVISDASYGPLKTYTKPTECNINQTTLTRVVYCVLDQTDTSILHIRETISYGQHSSGLNILGRGLSGAGITDTGINIAGDDVWRSQSYTNYELNGIVYPKVQRLFRKDTTGITGSALYQVYIAAGSGVICYQFYPDNVIWSLKP